jgi:tetratricopeptide (TPR) repeat protein
MGALNIFRETGDRFGLGIALGRLAYAYLRQEELVEAISFLRQAADSAREIDDYPTEAWATEVLGTAMYGTGQKDAARETWQTALTLYQRIFDGEGTARVKVQLANPDFPPPTPRPRP